MDDPAKEFATAGALDNRLVGSQRVQLAEAYKVATYNGLNKLAHV